MATRCSACNMLVTTYTPKQDGSEEDLCNYCLEQVQDSLNDFEEHDYNETIDGD